MKEPLVSFITICYNGYNDTCELIDSLQEHIRSVTFEIIVVDNNSLINEASLLQQKYSAVKTIRSERNSGFSGGNNLGIRAAKGAYLFLINNDTYVVDDHIITLIKRLESDNTIGGVSPKIKFAFPPQHIQYAGYTPLTPITLRNEPIGFGNADDGSYDTPSVTSYLHGAAMMIKREVIEKAGLMPEIFFLYYEELDWSARIKKAGFTLWYEPGWVVFHKESQSTGQLSRLRTFYMTRNRLLYAWRNLTGINRYLSIFYQITLPVLKSLFVYSFKRRPDLIVATFSGVCTFFKLKNKL